MNHLHSNQERLTEENAYLTISHRPVVLTPKPAQLSARRPATDH
ncbi:hypothetical protein SNL152K_10250 [Streptomyces sp. NL15-2K]|nr:hypothetical protein SNL152K_10250 [Streptomyces sp. NL15-2K]